MLDAIDHVHQTHPNQVFAETCAHPLFAVFFLSLSNLSFDAAMSTKFEYHVHCAFTFLPEELFGMYNVMMFELYEHKLLNGCILVLVSA